MSMPSGRSRQLVLLALLLGVSLLSLGLPALADARDISVGGVWITRLDHGAAGFTPLQRAVEVRRRITEVLSTPEFRQGAVVSVKEFGQDAVITVGDVLVFTVTPQDASGSWLTPVEVAHQWARLLAEGLSRAIPDADFHSF
jgi:hypothetical protein